MVVGNASRCAPAHRQALMPSPWAVPKLSGPVRLLSRPFWRATYISLLFTYPPVATTTPLLALMRMGFSSAFSA